MEFNLVTKNNTRFIKKFSELNSVIQSYRCKDFSLKQVSGLMGGGGGSDPPNSFPWIRHCFGAECCKKDIKGQFEHTNC